MAEPLDPETVAQRSELLPEEKVVGSDDPHAQAEAVLEDSETRAADRDAAPDKVVEHRTSGDVSDPPG